MAPRNQKAYQGLNWFNTPEAARARELLWAHVTLPDDAAHPLDADPTQCWITDAAMTEGQGRLSPSSSYLTEDGDKYTFPTAEAAWTDWHGRPTDKYLWPDCGEPRCVNPNNGHNREVDLDELKRLTNYQRKPRKPRRTVKPAVPAPTESPDETAAYNRGYSDGVRSKGWLRRALGW